MYAENCVLAFLRPGSIDFPYPHGISYNSMVSKAEAARIPTIVPRRCVLPIDLLLFPLDTIVENLLSSNAEFEDVTWTSPKPIFSLPGFSLPPCFAALVPWFLVP